MATNYNFSIVRDGLVMYLDAANPKSCFSGSTSWTDISRNGNNGSQINGPIFNNSNGGSLAFDGVDDWVDTFLSAGGEIPRVTVNAWIKVSSFSTGQFGQVIINPWFGSWTLQIDNATAITSFYVTSGSFNSQVVNSKTPLTSSQWYMLTGTYGSSVDLYINGALDQTTGSPSFNLPSVSSYGSGFIGVSWRRRFFPFYGDIAQIQVYNRGLSASEILQNYNATKKRFGL